MKYRDLITGSLRLLGVVGQGQTAQGQEIVDGLNVLNEFIDFLNTQGQFLYAGKTETFAATGTISTSNVVINTAAYISNGTRYPLAIVDQTFINGVPNRDIVGTPAVIYSDNQYPTMAMSLYPIPQNGTVEIGFTEKLSAVTLDDVVSLPPAYVRMLRYNLAASLAPEYGLEVPQMVYKIASDTLDFITKQNYVSATLEYDIGSYGRFNINTGI